MPRYFIDTDDGHQLCRDDDGAVYGDLSAAEVEAMRALPDIARDCRLDGGDRTITAQIRDEAGIVVASATLRVTVERSGSR
ncbi:hypothetical protein [Methylobacterium sp. OT2]|uniref:DUF6894 family protein n=1 Tax=Methylobacterium sp. OT2 TaxID=2813779 RepID=UPI00197C0709|nr:hypothetical protein [Methylobacterium sp. OT2]MBN4096076.1 hypothetical protein [Methylobacterium sp. OT2]